MGSPVIFNGAYAKLLTSKGIKFNNNTVVISGIYDPASLEPDATAPNGSIYTCPYGLYVRQNSTWLKISADENQRLNTLVYETFESQWLGGLTGAEIISNPILHGLKTARIVHPSSGTYNLISAFITVDPKFRGKNNTLSLNIRSTALSANVVVEVYDSTNANWILTSTFTTGQITSAVFNTASSTTVTVTDNSILNQIKVGASITGAGIPTGTLVNAVNTSSGTITISQAATATATGVALKVSVLTQKQSYTFDIPNNCASLRYRVSGLAEAGSPETYIDDVEIELTQTALTTASISQTTFNSSDWLPFTPTGGWTANTTYTGYWRRSGDSMECRVKVTVSGVPTAAGLTINLPSGYSIDTAKLNSSTAGEPSVGTGSVNDSGVLSYVARAYYNTITSVVIYAEVTSGSYGNVSTVSPTVPFTFGANDNVQIEFKVPIVGWTSNTTSSTTIPLTSSIITQQSDSILSMANGTLSGSQTALDFSTTIQNIGSSVVYNGSTKYFNIIEEGLYDISVTDESASATVNTLAIIANISGSNYTLGTDDIATAQQRSSVSATAYLKTGDYIRFQASNSRGTGGNRSCQISKVGKSKIINPSSDQKIDIPTHFVKLEGTNGKGSVDTGIVLFSSIASIIGDGMSVSSTSANGTVITINKKGLLSARTMINSSTTAADIGISINQTTLTATTPPVSQQLALAENGSAYYSNLVTSNYPVNVGDKIRVFCDNTIGNSVFNALSLSLQETSVAVALQNVTPAWDASDSAIQVNTFNTFASTANSLVPRFSNQTNNFGTDITYVDDPTNGATFTVNKDGVYNISFTSYSDNVNDNFQVAITKNPSSFTAFPTGSSSLAYDGDNSKLSSVTQGLNVAWSGYLQKGDKIYPMQKRVTPAVTSNVTFSISRVGKTSGTVDVTPFVNVPTIDVEAIEALTSTSTFGSTNTGVPVLNITKNSNKGIIQVISDSVNGTSFKVLKDCEIKLTAGAQAQTSSTLYLTKNATVLTATSPDGAFAASGLSSSAGSFNASGSLSLTAGDIIRVQRNSTSLTSIHTVTLTATATSSAVATPTQSVSSDTLNFVWSGTALTGNEAVGTFNYYLYNINSNTPVLQTASAPNQSTSSMNTNGVQLFARAYNAAGVAGNPNRVDIVIGKGLKSKQVDAYVSAAKTTKMFFDLVTDGSTNAAQYGTFVAYDEFTGILTLDAGLSNGIVTTRTVGIYGAGNVPTTAYFVFNASKSPSLVTIPNLVQRVAYLKDVKTVGAGGGTSTATLWTNRDLNTIIDNTGIVTSLASNLFTLPAGTYSINVQMPFSGSVATAGMARLRNITDGITVDETQGYSGANTNDALCVFTAEVTINSSKQFAVQYWVTVGTATYGLGQNGSITGENNVFTRVTITKIK